MSGQKKNQRLNIWEGSLNAVSTGLTSSFLIPFALVLGASNAIVAAIATLPSLIGAFGQLGVQQVRSLFSSRRQHMCALAFLQALTWLPLLFIHTLAQPALWLLGIITLNTVLGFLIGPVWSSFTADIVAESERGRFFGRRNTFTGIAAFVSTLFAGIVLTVLEPSPLLGFSLLFALAFAFRAFAAGIFSRMSPPPEAETKKEFPSPYALLLHANKSPFGRFTLFLMLFYLSVYLASPFFTVYQLEILGFSYLQFTLLSAVSAITSFLTMFLWGRYVDRVGAANVLMASGLVIPAIPLVWSLTISYPVLFVTEMISGVVWAGFNLSASTYIFDATDRVQRTRQIAEYTLLIQLAVFSGAMVGSKIIDHYGAALAESYLNVFVLSTGLRFITVLLFWRVIREQRLIEIPVKGRLFRGFVTVRPQQGVVYEPAVASSSKRS